MFSAWTPSVVKALDLCVVIPTIINLLHSPRKVGKVIQQVVSCAATQVLLPHRVAASNWMAACGGMYCKCGLGHDVNYAAVNQQPPYHGTLRTLHWMFLKSSMCVRRNCGRWMPRGVEPAARLTAMREGLRRPGDSFRLLARRTMF
jgi:hypothetical protein